MAPPPRSHRHPRSIVAGPPARWLQLPHRSAAQDETGARRLIESVRWVNAILHTVLGVAAVSAGQAFIRDPSGGALGVDTAWLEGSPFPDYRVPGLFLAVIIGGANLGSAVLLWRNLRGAAWASFLTGLLLVAWVIVQTAILGLRHPSQLIWWLVFPLVATLGLILTRRR